MAVEVRVPGVGESVQEGMIESWHKSSGDWVDVDEVLLELETDKATVEVVAEVAGVLDVLIKEGEVVKVGDVIARIDESAEQAAGKTEPKKEAPRTAREEESKRQSPPVPEAQPKQPKASPTLEPGPAVRRLSAEEGVDVSQLAGSGRGGRVTKADVLEHLAEREKKDDTKNRDRIIAPQTQPREPQTAKEQIPVGGLVRADREEMRKPMSMIRRRIAERLLEAQKTAAILTTFNEVDMTEVMNLRNKYKDLFAEKYGIKLGFMGLFLKASVAALQAYPSVNAYIEGTDLLYHNYCDIGVAVSTAKGLLVPIVRDVDKLSLAEVELTIGQYAKKARENKISIDELTGGTFTVSNGGVFGSLLSTPILNPPQSGILGMHKTQMRPIVMPDGSIQARPMMYLALSYDHRIIDGKEAVSFLVKVKEVIEDPSRLILGV